MGLVTSPRTPAKNKTLSSWQIGSSSSSNDEEDDDDSDFSFVSQSSEEYLDESESVSIKEDDETTMHSPSPNPRKSRTRTVEVHSPMKHVASSEKVRRNTDSMLEDAFIAVKLKRRLGSR